MSTNNYSDGEYSPWAPIIIIVLIIFLVSTPLLISLMRKDECQCTYMVEYFNGEKETIKEKSPYFFTTCHQYIKGNRAIIEIGSKSIFRYNVKYVRTIKEEFILKEK